ncbi:MAG: SagB/ThcOx family dehydrogenase [Anaerolineae bacterium]|nr:SagB/ThcOx family dehydrogenase [Anaerolineae bacterium]MDW7991825.1 SagB/ThcOx family dehydrogenase [Anaerolineae bacterium]
MDTLILPPPRTDGPMSLEAAIAARRSVRSFTSQDLTLEEVSQLLWALQGITGPKEHFRAAPTAGACCPLEVYVCRADGVWHYRPQGHRLERHLTEDVRARLVEAAWNQSFLAQAPVVFAISAVFSRTTRRYGERGRVRYVPMDVGHAAQNLLLQAVALGLGSVPVGAFDDAAVARVLSLPREEEPLYLLPVGHPRTR